MYMQQGIMGSHASPDLWISAEKNPRSAELRRTFCDVEFRRTIGLNTKFRWKKTFSADVRCIICVVEFRRKTKKNIVRKKKCKRSRGRGLQKFRRKKKSAEVRYTICVVEFRRRTKSVKKQMQPIKGHRPPKVPPNLIFFSRSQDVSCPIIVRNGKKVHKVCKISCWKI